MQGITRAQANSARSSCTTCHRRKVKCDAHDHGFPCSNCRKSGRVEDCHLHRKHKRMSRAHRAQQAAHAAATSEDGRGTSTPGSLFLQTVIASASPAKAAQKQRETSKDGDASTSTSSIRGCVSSEDGRPVSDSSRQDCTRQDERSGRHAPDADISMPSMDTSAHSSPSTNTNTNTNTSTGTNNGHVIGVSSGEYKKYLVEFIDQPQITERPIDKDARNMYVGSEFSNTNFLLRQRFGEKTRGVSHYPTNRIARQHTCHETDRLPVEAFQLPPKKTVDQLLGAYFAHINPIFPVVDEVLFMQQYRARDPQNPPSLLLLHAILVAGAHVFYGNDEADGPEARQLHKAVFFRRAKILLDARFERNRDTIVQAALLLTWHADGPEDVGANAWFWIGLAARTATGLGMHRDAETSTLVPHNKRMWRRVWWLLVQCDVLVSLQYGRPPSIHLEDDVNVQRLRASDFQDCGSATRVDYVLHMTDLCVILADVLRFQFRRESMPAAERRAHLRKTDEALANWSLHLPPALQLWGVSTRSVPNVCTAIVHLKYNMALVLLHRQQPYRPPSSTLLSSLSSSSGPKKAETVGDDRNPEDVEICTNAAVAIQQIFQCLCETDKLKLLWSSSINCLFTALIQLSLEVRMSNPVLAVAALRRYDSALSSLRLLSDYWPNAQAIVQFFEYSVRLQSSTGLAAEPTAAATSQVRGPMGDGTDVQVESTPLVQNAEATTKESVPYPSTEAPEEQELVPMDEGPDITQLLATIVSSRQVQPFGGTQIAADPWNDWQRIYWQQPDSTDDFLFSF